MFRFLAPLALALFVAPAGASDAPLSEELRRLISSGALDELLLNAVHRASVVRRVAMKEAEGAQALANLGPVDLSSEHVYGPSDAHFILVEFSDFDCPYCQRFHSQAKAVVDALEDVAWVYRHLPIPKLHPKAFRKAVASECAASDSFFAFADALFAQPVQGDEAVLVALAQSLGHDPDVFTTCLQSEAAAQLVTEDIAAASRLGFRGTPASVLIALDSQRAVVYSGAVPAATLLDQIARWRQ